MENQTSFSGFKKMFTAFETICKPYCQEIGISVPAFEILLFIAKSEGVATAQDICKKQNIKPTLMSFHIEKLVQAGYVERNVVDGDRRSVKLTTTPSAAPIIQKGIELHQTYTALVWAGIEPSEKEQLFATLSKIHRNIEKIIQSDPKE